MIRGPLTHPEILSALASAGHGTKILISDFNYAHETRLGLNARVVYANLAPGLVRAADVLGGVAASVPIEAVAVMEPLSSGPYAMDSDPPVWAEYHDVLRARAGFTGDFDRLERSAFYEAASGDDHGLTVATGETSLYANILLTVGAILPGA